MPYNRLAIFIFAANAIIFTTLASTFSFSGHGITIDTILKLCLANFSIAILIRQQYVVNLLFKVATSAPLTWPLSIRWALAKVYHFGGIHVGAYFSGSLWFALFTLACQNSTGHWANVKLMSIFHLAILLGIMCVSLPAFRQRHHNQFEVIARFGNWTSLALFWAQTILIIKMNSQGSLALALLESPYIWILSLLTFSVALPWLRLKKVNIDLSTPSNHVALTSFNHGVTPFAGSSTELSVNPLFEWHSFANINTPNKEGFRLAISRAGDWTGRLIDKKPKNIWVKGIPTAGVGNVELLFKKVIWLATGSGLGPCLPHILANNVPSQLVWSTRTPRKTYGDTLVNEILAVQKDAIIWDTTEKGKPNLVELAYKAYRDSGAEAIICISNKRTTWNMKKELEGRGIPVLGAIWDS